MGPQIIQEARRILWPWCLMTLAGLAPVTKLFLVDKKSDGPEGIAVFGFFGGAAILTALSFRHAAFDSPRALLSSNVTDRLKTWSRTMLVLLIAVASAGLIACGVQTALGTLVWRELSANAIEPVLLLVIIVCSTGFWTLLARSAVGGILLAGAAQLLLYLLLVLFATAIDRLAPAGTGATRLSHDPEVHAALSWFVGGTGFSYAGVTLWLGRRRFAEMELRPNDGSRIRRFIQSFSSVTEFFLVLIICFGFTIAVTSAWLIRHLWQAPPASYNSLMHLSDSGAVVTSVSELATLGVVLWIGRIRGWSLTTFGFRLSWKWVAAGVFLFFAFLLVQRGTNWAIRGMFHVSADFHRISHFSLPFIILISIVNPITEEAIETSYVFWAVQRWGMWATVLVAAAIRAYLHATMGLSGFITMFAMGLLYGLVYWRWRQLLPLIVAHSLQMFYVLLPQLFAR